jgi:hypothetical protein
LLNKILKRIVLAAAFQAAVLSLGFGQKLDLNAQLNKKQMYKN